MTDDRWQTAMATGGGRQVLLVMMADGRWQMAAGSWQMAGGDAGDGVRAVMRWQMAGGRRQVADGGVADAWADGRWQVVMAGGRWQMAGDIYLAFHKTVL
jgi:hypothetical protein